MRCTIKTKVSTKAGTLLCDPHGITAWLLPEIVEIKNAGQQRRDRRAPYYLDGIEATPMGDHSTTKPSGYELVFAELGPNPSFCNKRPSASSIH